ncbi:hypothetical protein QE152_g1138 [Popillia japonica]|uniref:Uncharacterized protein n=1 Tax=Popillia japonica TaxID=7064 RepID=A0AAW1N875_POPJA
MLTFKQGGGVLNSLINNLPVELHLPGYQYCGPGTKLQKRIARGDPGLGMGLKKKAFKKSVVVKAKGVMKKFKGNIKEGAKLSLTAAKLAVKAAGGKKRVRTPRVIPIPKQGGVSLTAAKLAVKAAGGKKRVRTPRVIPIPKQGGVLPLIPLFAGLSAIGSLAGGAAGIATAVNKAKTAQNGN